MIEDNRKYKIAILGAGSWGIALALVLEYNGHNVTLWEFRPKAAEQLQKQRDAKEFLPGIIIPSTIEVSNHLESSCNEKDILVVAVPSHVVRSVAKQLNKIQFTHPPVIVNVAKGIENESLLRMSQVMKLLISRQRL